MNKSQFLLLSLVLSGCAAVDPFVKSDEATMAKVINEAQVAQDLDKWIKGAGSASVVFINMEDNSYTNDQLPEYMIHDALYTKIKDGNSSVRILERDPDILSMLQREKDGVDLPASWKNSGGDNGDSLTVEQRRHEVGALIRAIVKDISPQDNLVELDDCCGEKGIDKEYLESIIANEVGSNKSELLQKLVDEYLNLYPKVKSKSAPTRQVDVDNADFLIAYRVYDFGTYRSRTLGGANRISFVKLHVRVVDMDTGEVIVSDFMENKDNDRLSRKELTALVRTNASQSDYGRPASRSSKGGSEKPATPAAPPTPSYSVPEEAEENEGIVSKLTNTVKGLVDKITFWN